MANNRDLAAFWAVVLACVGITAWCFYSALVFDRLPVLEMLEMLVLCALACDGLALYGRHERGGR